MLDNINLIDEDYKTVRKDSRVSSNQIKTRQSSFNAISKNWTGFRVSLLKQKLERVQKEMEEAQTKISSDGADVDALSREIEEKNAVITRLEEKIRVLAKDSVPSSYVTSRAIKLSNRKDMFNNLVANGKNAYQTMEKEDIVSVVDNDVNDEIDVEKIASNDEEIISSNVENAMSSSESQSVAPITRDDISSIIDKAYSETYSGDYSPVEISPEDVEKEVSSVKPETEVEVETKADVFDTQMEEKPVEDTYAVDRINRDEIEATVNEKLSNLDFMNAGVSRNEAASAKIDNYDEDGFPKAKMEEDIKDERLSDIFDSINIPQAVTFNAKAVDSIKPKEETDREDIVVVPSREEEKEQDLHFDYSDATEKDVVRASQIETSADGLEALKMRVLELKEKNKQSKMDLDETRREQSEEAQRAMDIQKAAEEKEQSFQASLSKFRDYCEALEQDTEINESLLADARTDIESNRRLIEAKQAEIEDYDRKMMEIDSYISPEAINVRLR